MSRLRLLVLLGFMVGIFAFAGAAYCTRDGRIVCLPGDTGLCGGTGGGPPPPPPTATPVPAPVSCPVTTQRRCYAFYGARDIQVDGAFAQFDFEPYTAPDWSAGGHSNQTLWLGAGPDWCEVGWAIGSVEMNQPDNDAVKAYFAYQSGSTYNEISDTGYPLGAYGTVHAFQIQRIPSSGVAYAIIDEHATGICPIDVPSTDTELGLEYTDENAVNQSVAPFDWQVRGYYGDYGSAGSWEPWYLGGADTSSGACISGNGAYFAWVNPDQQFIDSSNITASDHGQSSWC